jgi:electron transfer flavoprotein beta subunit|tara:strand:- start:2306 stop:3112 length:807 start_codon:yes stop_codon:yes gene_type:complete
LGVRALVRIIVLLKDIVDLELMKVNLKTSEPIIKGIKRKISDLDTRALEAALKLKESNKGEVITLSIGGSETRTVILAALAMGADRAYIIKNDKLARLDSRATSKVIRAAVEKIGPYDLIIGGEMSLDSLSSQTIPRIAELLNLPQVTYVKEIKLYEGTLQAVRDLEDVDEIVEVDLPAAVAVVREINEPRIPSLMNIMKAKRKPIKEWEVADLGLSIEEINALSSIEIQKIKTPKVNRKRIVIKADTVTESAAKLVKAIISEGVLES